MKLITSEGEIERIRKAHRDLEIKVAQSIGECIEAACGTPLRQAVRLLLGEIISIPTIKLDSVLLKQADKGFAMFASGEVQPNWASLARLYALGWRRLSLETCSDIIRLFGECCEDPTIKNLTGSNWKDHEAEKEKLKPAPVFLKPEDSVKKGWSKEEDPKDERIGHRARTELKGQPIPRSAGPYVPIPAAVNRGVDKFVLAGRSVIGALDSAFGLERKGADVSGTTTDSMYALKYALETTQGEGFQHLSLAQLLPIATMVPAGHHALIECAWPLSRRNYIDYHIGYYDTVIPKNCTDEARRKLATALLDFEPVADRLHVLVYRAYPVSAGFKERGLLMENQREILAFKKLAKLLSAYGWCVAGELDSKLVENLLNRNDRDGLLRDELFRNLPAGWNATPPPIPPKVNRPKASTLVGAHK